VTHDGEKKAQQETQVAAEEGSTELDLHFHSFVTVEGATMQAVTFRARVCAPVGLTARVARAHTAKAFAAPRTKGASKRPVVLVRAAEGAPSLHKPRTDRKRHP
tara:strand:- start:44 stop:355 length:312 start_codon:yes stop_codon:yes gene_type:complete